MTNRQLAAARKVMNRFATLRVRKEGNILTPIANGGSAGTPVEITENMSDTAVSSALSASCQALLNG